MTEIDWGSEAKELPKPKKRVPTWLWFVGGGCSLALVVAIVVGAFFVRSCSRMMNQDEQWAKLGKFLPFDEQPAGLHIMGTGEFASLTPGIDDMWTIQGGGMWQAQITVYSGHMGEELRKQIASGDLGDDARRRLGPLGLFELEHGQGEIQGRTVPWLRFQLFEKEADEPPPDAKSSEDQKEMGVREAMKMAFKQRLMIVDLTKEGDAHPLILQYTSLGPGKPVDIAEPARFLEPFHVGPNR